MRVGASLCLVCWGVSASSPQADRLGEPAGEDGRAESGSIPASRDTLGKAP